MITLSANYQAGRDANPSAPVNYEAHYSTDDGANWTAFPTDGELLLPLGQLTQETESEEFNYVGPDLELTCNNSTGFWTKSDQTGLLDGESRVMVRVRTNNASDTGQYINHILGFVDLATVQRQDGGYCSFVVRGVLNALDYFLSTYQLASVELGFPHKFRGWLEITAVEAGHTDGLYQLKYNAEDESVQWNNGPKYYLMDDTPTAIDGVDGKSITVKQHFVYTPNPLEATHHWRPISTARGQYPTKDVEQWIAIKSEKAYEPPLFCSPSDMASGISSVATITNSARHIPIIEPDFPVHLHEHGLDGEVNYIGHAEIGDFWPYNHPPDPCSHGFIVSIKNGTDKGTYLAFIAYLGSGMPTGRLRFSVISITKVLTKPTVRSKRVVHSGSVYYWIVLDETGNEVGEQVFGTNVHAHCYDVSTNPWTEQVNINLNYLLGSDTRGAQIAFKSVVIASDSVILGLARPNYGYGVYDMIAPFKAVYDWASTTTFTELESRIYTIDGTGAPTWYHHLGPFAGDVKGNNYVIAINRGKYYNYTYDIEYFVWSYRWDTLEVYKGALAVSGNWGPPSANAQPVAVDLITGIAINWGALANEISIIYNLCKCSHYYNAYDSQVSAVTFQELDGEQGGIYTGRTRTELVGGSITTVMYDGADENASDCHFIHNDGYDNSASILVAGDAVWGKNKSTTGRGIVITGRLVDNGGGNIRAGAYCPERMLVLLANRNHLIIIRLNPYCDTLAASYQLCTTPLVNKAYRAEGSYRSMVEEYAKAFNCRLLPKEHTKTLVVYSKEATPDSSGTIGEAQYVFDDNWYRRKRWKAVRVNGVAYSDQMYSENEVLDVSAEGVHPCNALSLAKYIYDTRLDTKRLHKIITDWLVEYEPGDRVSFEITDEAGNNQTKDALIISTETNFDNRTHAMILLEIEGD